MKNMPTNNYPANMPDELKAFRKPLPVAKKPGYVYTEEDLGEDILEISS
jgi:hypothetical protein